MDADKFQKQMIRRIKILQDSIDVIGDLFSRLEDKLDRVLQDDESAGEDWKPPGWKPGEGD